MLYKMINKKKNIFAYYSFLILLQRAGAVDASWSDHFFRLDFYHMGKSKERCFSLFKTGLTYQYFKMVLRASTYICVHESTTTNVHILKSMK